MFDFSTLITDRSDDDYSELISLLETPREQWTDKQRESFYEGKYKGGYSWVDINRVNLAMNALNYMLTELGYNTGYIPASFEHKPEESQGILPRGYTQLKWLRFSGAQYIDSGVKGTQNTKLEISYYNEQAPNSAVFGADSGWTVNSFGIWVNTQIIAPVFGNQTGSIGLSFNPSLDTMSLDSSGVIFNGTRVWTAPAVSPFTTDHNIAIGAVNRSGTIYENFIGKIGPVNIFENGQEVKNLIPCKSPTGQCGYYDLISNNFSGNSGSGEIEAGTEIPLPETPKRDPFTFFMDDAPPISVFNLYLDNVKKLKNAIKVPVNTPNAPFSMESIKLVDANNIEKILLAVEETINRMETTFVPCGTATCGGDYL